MVAGLTKLYISCATEEVKKKKCCLNHSKLFPENIRATALYATSVSNPSHSGERSAGLVWSLFIYRGFNLNNMFQMRPVMLFSTVALWLKLENSLLLPSLFPSHPVSGLCSLCRCSTVLTTSLLVSGEDGVSVDGTLTPQS